MCEECELPTVCPVSGCIREAEYVVVNMRTHESHPFCEMHADWSLNAHLN